MTERASLGVVRVRLAEIRAENHQGDVSADEIAWLCDVAGSALDRAICCLNDSPKHPSAIALERALRGRTA